MALEIEWKLFVTRLPALPQVPSRSIVQGYFDPDGRPAIRVRLKDGKATLNFKHPLENARQPGGPQQCHEFEYSIPDEDGEALLELARHRIGKRRYLLPSGIELDVFEGPHAGLIVAELEVEEAGDAPTPPQGWEWTDVSSDVRFSNRWMAENGIPDGAPAAVIDS